MKSLIWKSEFNTGNEAIDSQHKRLVELFNKLYESIENKVDKEEIISYLNGFDSYANFHFQIEEEKLKRLPENVYITHKKEHDKFKTITHNVKNEIFNKGKHSSLFEMVLYLNDWILNHITHEDIRHLKNDE
ncbi:MAG: bacteriohemerythrin [Spirochaetia bacterium]|nr:bacteriohemerythrin [Spirochaetia bacterium]